MARLVRDLTSDTLKVGSILSPPTTTDIDTITPTSGSNLIIDNSTESLFYSVKGSLYQVDSNLYIKDYVPDPTPTIGLVGVGCAGSYLLNQLSKKYRVLAYEAGINRTMDGVTFNLAVAGPAVHADTDIVAAQGALGVIAPGPVGAAQQWAGITFIPLYNVVTNFSLPPVGIPGFPATPAQLGQASRGCMIGGSSDHIQGVYVNPSRSRCDWWASILDDRYLFENLFPRIIKMEKFRAHTPSTNQTYDGTFYTPRDGPSVASSFPINRGDDGVLQVVQASPSPFATVLGKTVYQYFHDTLGYSNFKLTPTIEDNKSLTFNSGVDICVTTAIERFLDVHRSRTSIARGYLNDSVMINTADNLLTPYLTVNTQGYYINSGLYKGINGHNFDLNLYTKIQRIVFQTKPGYPDGHTYWMNNYVYTDIDPNAFVRPLKAIGLEYGPDLNNRTFVPCTDVICTLGTIGTPALLMQSGIGPASVLSSLGIPVLKDQPNLGKYLSNHVGAVLRWTGNASIWNTSGATPAGTDASNGYLPGPDSPVRRKFQYFSAFSTTTNPPNTWSMSFYDLNTKSTGYVNVNQNWDTSVQPPAPPTAGSLLPASIVSNYYTDPNGDDIRNLCWILRNCAAMVIAKDPSAQFYIGTPPAVLSPIAYPFPADDNTMLAAFAQSLTSQTHYVGTCGMGKDPNIHCVDTEFLLRGTSNVRVCDASSMPLEVEANGVVYPVQNDGNTIRGVNVLSVVCAEQLLNSLS